ncbi:MAG TPA: hypothetical protein VK605_04530 [Solirubrobacteraceae bacterium]|nr:hypothetical protein [Solirubrobacteraceae bacterium]
MPLPGLPSLHGIIEAIAKGYFGALAHALVPSWLKHGTVATIQHLVALPDPASWTHVGQLQGDMVYLGAMLLPVTLAVSAVRYWLVGLTGAAHPIGAVGRCASVTFVLVAYRWFVEQAVAAANTLTHAVLGFPVVANGLQRLVGVLFGGALLSGAGGVFGALLVIVGVLFAAGLFAAQVLLTLVLAVMIVAGPPLIALSAIPELSHLARTWAHALLAIALVPFGWTVLFATAGALCLDATSFTGGAGGLPGHVAAAFAGLITFAIAVRLPLMLLGELRHLLGAAGMSHGARGGSSQSAMPGAERVRAAQARLRSAAFEGIPSLGRSAGRAAGALGAPAGGPLGAAGHRLAGAARRGGILPATAAGVLGGGVAGRGTARTSATPARRGVRERLRSAGVILANAPSEARAAMVTSSRKAARRATSRAGSPPAPTAAGKGAAASNATGSVAANLAPPQTPPTRRSASPRARTQRPVAAPGGARGATASTRAPSPGVAVSGAERRGKPAGGAGPHPGAKVKSNAAREAAGGASKQATNRPRPKRQSKPPPPAPAPPRSQRPGRRAVRRKPRPRRAS